MFVATGVISNNKNQLIPEKVITFVKSVFTNRIFSSVKNDNFNIVVLSLISCKNQQFVFETENERCFIICEISNKQEIAKISGLNVNDYNFDAELLFNAYKRLGKNIFKQCCGKWAFIVENQKSGTIELWRDHMGMYSIYYFIKDEEFYFSTHLNTLLQYDNSPKRINNIHAAGLVYGFAGTENATIFNDIYKVPSASCVTITKSGIKSERYWQIDSKIIKYSKDSDYYEHFYHILNQVLDENICSEDLIASTLSSGLDSSFLTAYLSKYMLNKGKSIYAITSVPLKEFEELNVGRRYGNEEPLAELVAQKYSNIIHIKDNAIDKKVIDSLQKSLIIHGYPVRNAMNQHWILSMFEKLQAHGINKLFIAQMGNLTVSWPFVESTSNNFIAKMYKIVSKYTPAYTKKFVNSNKEYFNKSFFQNNQLHFYLWKNAYYPNFDSWTNSAKRKYFLNQLLLQGFSSWIEKGIYYGINVIDPFADPRVVEYSFSVPNKMYKNANGTRLFIKNLARNFVPNEIINNQKKAIQSADIEIRLRNEINDIAKIIESSLHINDLNDIFNSTEIIKQMSEKKIKNHVFIRLLLIKLFFQFATIEKKSSYK